MTGSSVAFDSVLDLCQHQHRRVVLALLTEEQRALTLEDLTQAILKYNHETPVTEAPEDVIAETRLSLHHIHLPKSAAEGFVTYYSGQNLVEPTDQLERVQPTVSTIIDADPALEPPIEL